jgi:hypothetical protein
MNLGPSKCDAPSSTIGSTSAWHKSDWMSSLNISGSVTRLFLPFHVKSCPEKVDDEEALPCCLSFHETTFPKLLRYLSRFLSPEASSRHLSSEFRTTSEDFKTEGKSQAGSHWSHQRWKPRPLRLGSNMNGVLHFKSHLSQLGNSLCLRGRYFVNPK